MAIKKGKKNCSHEDDVGEKMFAETYTFKIMFAEDPSPPQKNNGPSLMATTVLSILT